MENRWLVLTVLFVVRIAMGVQYQSVGSVSSLLVEDLDIDYAQLGALIGFYDMPGILLAFPSGLLGHRFGDKRIVVMGLGLMVVSGLLMSVGYSYALAAAGRLIGGVGAVLLNVLLTKIIADWFAGREIVTAMAILVSSWPVGISLGLISLGPIATASSWLQVMRLTAVACTFALALVVFAYRSPSSVGDHQQFRWKGFDLSQREVGLVVLAGILWTLFNFGIISLPSFAPAFLTTAGWTLAEAGSLVSVVTWILIPTVQLGGYLADRIGRPDVILVICFLGIGLAICLLPHWSNPLALFVALGLLFGPPAGIIMALPAEVLRPENRALGMGIYYTCSYAGLAALPAVAGLSRDLTENPAAPLLLAGALLFIAVVVLGFFRALQRRGGGMTS